MSQKDAHVSLLHKISQSFANSLDLQVTLESVLHLLDQHLQLNRGTITVLDEDSETIHITVAHGLSDEAKKLGLDNNNIHHFENKELAIESLNNLINKDDVVLVKASRGMKLEQIVEYLSK